MRTQLHAAPKRAVEEPHGALLLVVGAAGLGDELRVAAVPAEYRALAALPRHVVPHLILRQLFAAEQRAVHLPTLALVLLVPL